MRQRQFSRGLRVTCPFAKRMLVRVVVAGLRTVQTMSCMKFSWVFVGHLVPLAYTDLKSIARTSQTMAA